METKNQQSNFNNPIIIILVITLIALGGYVLFSKSSNTSDNKVSDLSNNPTTESTSNQDTDNTKVTDLQACSQQSDANFKSIITSETKNSADLKEIRTYTNHFNTTDKKCYMVITNISSELGSKMQRLYDVYDNKELASNWKVKNPNDPTDQSPGLCIIYNGDNKAYGDCNITHIFEEKMESTTY